MANRAVIELRRRLLDEWRAWRSQVLEEGLYDPEAEAEMEPKDEGDGEVVEEIVEEIIEESEEVVN